MFLRRLSAALLIVAATVPAQAQMVQLSAEQIGDIFCIARLGNDMAPVEGLLSPVLAAAIGYAEARNAVIAAAAPDEKPPLGDGVPWQAFPDYAPVCTASVSEPDSPEPVVDITYAFPDQPAAGWTDKLLLAREGDVFRIYDIAFDKSAESLQGVLAAIFSN